MKGWGDWTGTGSKPNPRILNKQAEEKRKRIEMIRMLRKKDKNKNVIVHKNRNKRVREYQVDRLPHPFKNKDQFNYINNQALGAEWTGLRHQDRFTKPKNITQVGEIVAPIKKKKNRNR